MTAALALTTLSFAAGIAGDLASTEQPNSGTSVVLRIPPELPADTPRAAPLPPITTPTAAAEAPAAPRRAAARPAARERTQERAEPVIEARAKPARTQSIAMTVKSEPDRAPKAPRRVERRKAD
ncbi:MAG: hypothetical protein R3C16_09780 [Hyphomonadaceae bacterium]